MSSTSDFDMLSPNPVPLYFLVALVSTWAKGSNKVLILALSIPIPVSLIAVNKTTVFSAFSFSEILMLIWPVLVNLMALPIRLVITCL